MWLATTTAWTPCSERRPRAQAASPSLGNSRIVMSSASSDRESLPMFATLLLNAVALNVTRRDPNAFMRRTIGTLHVGTAFDRQIFGARLAGDAMFCRRDGH